VSPSVKDNPERPVVAVVGRNIAALRRERGWSLGELARRADVGKATLSEIESGRRNATIETLYALTTALGVPLSAPLVDVPAASERRAPLLTGETVEAELVAHYRDAAIITELYRIRVRAGKPAHHAAHAPGVHKSAIVFAGELRVGFGDAQIEIAAGNSGSFSAERPHTYQAVGRHDVHGALLMRYPPDAWSQAPSDNPSREPTRA